MANPIAELISIAWEKYQVVPSATLNSWIAKLESNINAINAHDHKATGADLGADTVGNSQMQDDAISNTELQTDAISKDKMRDNSVGVNEIDKTEVHISNDGFALYAP